MASNKKTVVKKKVLKNIHTAVAHIHSTFNNTIVALSDPVGNIICWKSSGTAGYKGTKKGTPFAAQLAAEEAAKIAKEHGVKKAEVKVKGLGSGREAAIRSLQANGIEIVSIKDVTPLPHNGCRAPKKRRI